MLKREDYVPLIERALTEDLHEAGDITSRAIFSDRRSVFDLRSKDSGVLAGSEVCAAVFHTVDASVAVEFHRADGDVLSPGDLVATVSGSTLSVLTAERTAINFIAFLSGIATETGRYVEAAAGRAAILDTRKTLPGYRALSKYAVSVGGGRNHRIGLYDMVMIKDNHIDEAGSITEAVRRVRDTWGNAYRVEVECRTESEVEEAQSCGVEVIMLDNMDNETMRRCVSRRAGETAFEASGNMTLDRIPGVAATGVDLISIGAMTHSVVAFDYSLTSRRKDA